MVQKSLIVLKLFVQNVVFGIQILLLHLGRLLARRCCRMKQSRNLWVIGPMETSNVVSSLAMAVPNAISVNLQLHRFYSNSYSYCYRTRFAAAVLGPLLLGHLSRKVSGFVYVGAGSFLTASTDFRSHEFRMLKKWGCRIVSFQTGSEIRSVEKLYAWGNDAGVETVAHVIKETTSSEVLMRREHEVRRRASVIDAWADLIFNSEIDQMSYLQSDFQPVFYLLPDEQFDYSTQKFHEISEVVICHAPSNPTLKGTKQIRDAVEQLKNEGCQIKYIELINQSHDDVMRQLETTHVVVNELFAMLPGVFAIEAMAKMCVVLTSADWRHETNLVRDSKSPWIVSNRSNLYQNLKWCIHNKEKLLKQAQAGQEWAITNASLSRNADTLNRLLLALQ